MASKRKQNSNNTIAEPSMKKPKQATHWALGLLNSVDDPKLHVMKDDEVTVIKDKYPKAKYHYLVIPHENISSLKHVNKKHIDLLKHMDEVGRQLTKRDGDHEKCTFKLGYHAQPSMVRLHLHIISDDMNSECLKTKKHWNSFTSKFFLDSNAVISELGEKGTISMQSPEECKTLLNLPLKCHKCNIHLKNMPELKKHITTH